MTHEIKIPVEVAQEATYRPFEVRFTGALSEVESELTLSARNGDADWCSTFRDIHDGDLAERAPVDMLKEFADDAPSPLLRGYVLGIMFARGASAGLKSYSADFAALAKMADEPELRGMALGCAFMAGLAPEGSCRPDGIRPAACAAPNRSRSPKRNLRGGRS